MSSPKQLELYHTGQGVVGRHQYSKSLFKLKQKKYTSSCPSSNKCSSWSKSYNARSIALFRIAQPFSRAQRLGGHSVLATRTCTSARHEHCHVRSFVVSSQPGDVLRYLPAAESLLPGPPSGFLFRPSLGGNRLLWGLSLSPLFMQEAAGLLSSKSSKCWSRARGTEVRWRPVCFLRCLLVFFGFIYVHWVGLLTEELKCEEQAKKTCHVSFSFSLEKS